MANVFSTVPRFQKNLNDYQNLIMRSMYDKQLDSGRGTLLHMCDDVIQQEVSSELEEYLFNLLVISKLAMLHLDN